MFKGVLFYEEFKSNNFKQKFDPNFVWKSVKKLEILFGTIKKKVPVSLREIRSKIEQANLVWKIDILMPV